MAHRFSVLEQVQAASQVSACALELALEGRRPYAAIMLLDVVLDCLERNSNNSKQKVLLTSAENRAWEDALWDCQRAVQRLQQYPQAKELWMRFCSRPI